MILKLNLPKPSNDLVVALYDYCRTPNYRIEMHDNLNKKNSKKNSAIHSTDPTSEIIRLCKDQYQSLLPNEVLYPTAFMIHSLSGISSYPPHTDRQRTLALNYYFELGGDNVRTVFYKQKQSDVYPDDPTVGSTADYEMLDVHGEYATHTNEWYALNVGHYHSVENIETTRIILSIGMPMLSFDQFKMKYDHLLSSSGNNILLTSSK